MKKVNKITVATLLIAAYIDECRRMTGTIPDVGFVPVRLGSVNIMTPALRVFSNTITNVALDAGPNDKPDPTLFAVLHRKSLEIHRVASQVSNPELAADFVAVHQRVVAYLREMSARVGIPQYQEPDDPLLEISLTTTV